MKQYSDCVRKCCGTQCGLFENNWDVIPCYLAVEILTRNRYRKKRTEKCEMHALTTGLVALAAFTCLLGQGVAAQSGCAQCPSVVGAVAGGQLCAAATGIVKFSRVFDSACALDRHNCLYPGDSYIFKNKGPCPLQGVDKLLISPVQTNRSLEQKAQTWPIQYAPLQQGRAWPGTAYYASLQQVQSFRPNQQFARVPTSFYNPFRGQAGAAPTSWVQQVTQPVLVQYRQPIVGSYQQTTQFLPIAWPVPPIAVPLPPKPITTTTTTPTPPTTPPASIRQLAALCNVDGWQCSEMMMIDGTTKKCVVAVDPAAGTAPLTTNRGAWKTPFFCDDSLNILAKTMAPASASTAPPAYTTLEGLGYFKVHTEWLRWDQAQAVCVSEGSNLAVPSKLPANQAIFDLLEKTIPTQFDGAFVGITDVAVEGTFLAVTGQPLCTMGDILFRPGEPNDVGGQDCLAIGWAKDKLLTDNSCLTPSAFICEQPLPALLLPSSC